MPTPHTRTLRLFLLLSSIAVLAAAQTGPEPASSPEARLQFGAAAPAPKAATAAERAHPASDGGPGLGTSAVTLSFAEVALSAVPERSEGAPRFHIQGELFQQQDDITSAEVPSYPTQLVDSSRPEVSRSRIVGGDVETSFDGLTSTGWIPPDTVGAVGPSHFLQSTNSGLAVYSKTGSTVVAYKTFDTFFDPVKPAPWAGFMFDPRVIYSAEHAKFVVLVLGLDQTNMTSSIFIGVSQTSDPGGIWWIWRLNSNFAGFTADAWLDYAGLGADTWGIYVTGNYFLWAGGFKYSTIISLDPAMFMGGASNGWQFVDLKWPSTSVIFSPQPALPLSIAGGAETFFVNSWSGFGNQLLLWTLTGDRTSSPGLTSATVDVASYSALGENVDQPGTATNIDGGDSRIMNAFYAQRRLYTALTNDTNGNASSSGAFLAKVNVDSKTAEWNTTLDGGAGWYYFFPAIVIGDPIDTTPPVSVFISWTYPPGTYYASAAVRTYHGPPDDQTGPFPALAYGLSTYVALDSGNRNRWGDYNGAGYDFTNQTVWGATEYAGTANTWRTRIAELNNGIFTDGFESGNTIAWASTSP